KPVPNDKRLIAAIRFHDRINEDDQKYISLYGAIYKRHTNRNLSSPPILSDSIYKQLTEMAESIPSARIKWFKERKELDILAKIIGACDRIRLLNEEGHDDFVNHEMRWTPEEAESKKDGIDVQTLGL